MPEPTRSDSQMQTRSSTNRGVAPSYSRQFADAMKLNGVVNIEEETLGLVAVDVFGHPCRIETLQAMASDAGWALIEDSCEALGSRSRGRPLGSFGNAGVFAFYPNKQVTTGEGGVVVTDDLEVAGRVRRMANQGRDDEGTWLRHVELGFNYRLDELSAAVGVAQLRRFDELRAGRARVAESYRAALAHLDAVKLPRPSEGADVDWFVYVIRLDGSIDRDRLIDDLAADGIPSRPYFSPLHLLPGAVRVHVRVRSP